MGKQKPSASVKDALKAIKAKLADKRGEPKTGLARGDLPGYKNSSGTPAYIKSAAEKAEAYAKSVIKRDGGGKYEAPLTHRVPESRWSAGKPPTKKEADAHPCYPGGQSGKP